MKSTLSPPASTLPEQAAKQTRRLAVVLSHPVQYYAPWFQQLNEHPDIDLHVFYLWNREQDQPLDRGFGIDVQWDIPLLEGYSHEFVPNVSRQPGTHHFRGLNNPDLPSRLTAWNPDAVLFFGYAWQTHLRTILSPELRSIPFLFRGDSHDLFPSTNWKSRMSARLRRLLFRRFDGFLSVGSANREYLLHAGVPRDRIEFTPHCIDNDRFSGALPRARREAEAWKVELGIAHDRPVVLFAGKMEEKKRPLDLLSAFLSMESSPGTPTPALLFSGSGPLEDDLKKKAGDRIGDRVFFAPFQNQTEMPKVYATGDLLVLPSHGRGETWGLAVNEAMNLQTPALVSSHVGCGPDLIRHGSTGWVFEAGDRKALAEALRSALSDRERLAEVGVAAADHVRNYSYEHATHGLLRSLGRVCHA